MDDVRSNSGDARVEAGLDPRDIALQFVLEPRDIAFQFNAEATELASEATELASEATELASEATELASEATELATQGIDLSAKRLESVVGQVRENCANGHDDKRVDKRGAHTHISSLAPEGERTKTYQGPPTVRKLDFIRV